MDWFAELLVHRARKWVAYSVSIAGPFLGLAVHNAIAGALLRAPFITFYPAVIISSLIGGVLPGLVSAFISTLLVDYFVFAPLNSFSLSWIGGVIPILSFDIVAVTVAVLLGLAMGTISMLSEASNVLKAKTKSLEQQFLDRTVELEETEERLRQAQKMEAVGQLTGGLAHDFNNLMTAITGSLELLNRKIGLGKFDDLRKYTTIALDAAGRASSVTHRLLAFSSRQTLAPELAGIGAMVAGMMELISRSVGPSINLDFADTDASRQAFVDPSQLENAVLNLCLNSRDALPDGGNITIRTAGRYLDADAANALELPEGDYIALSVSDDGDGMPPDIVKRAFDPFFTTKPIGRGTGLGLSMVYGFARQSGGNVQIHSAPGKGATVTIYLPVAVEEVTSRPSEREDREPSLANAAATILVVDDEVTVRMLITETLEDLGYKTVAAAEGGPALEILNCPVTIDLLISDVGLPGGMNGRQLADAARALHADLKVLFITGYAENAFAKNGQLESGMHIMTKPFTMDALAERVREILIDT